MWIQNKKIIELGIASISLDKYMEQKKSTHLSLHSTHPGAAPLPHACVLDDKVAKQPDVGGDKLFETSSGEGGHTDEEVSTDGSGGKERERERQSATTEPSLYDICDPSANSRRRTCFDTATSC